MSATELQLRAAREEDLPALSAFMQAQGQLRCSPEYLLHWYFRDPEGSASVIIGELEGRIVGMATSKDHRFVTAGHEALVSMPQKVLTDASLRGGGIFGRLYRAGEQACLDRGVEFFLTVTNAASTPIFLGKFGYQRLPSPGMRVLSPRPGAPRDTSADLARMRWSAATPEEGSWRMARSEAYLRWRYLDHPLKEYSIGRGASDDGKVEGAIITKRIRKKGVPVMLLMDVLPSDPAFLVDLMGTARKLAWRERCLAVLGLQNEFHEPAMRDSGFSWAISSGFNLLVKGRDEAHTRELLTRRFDLTFGDLDFF